jgi:hypothetical protein
MADVGSTTTNPTQMEDMSSVTQQVDEQTQRNQDMLLSADMSASMQQYNDLAISVQKSGLAESMLMNTISSYFQLLQKAVDKIQLPR